MSRLKKERPRLVDDPTSTSSSWNGEPMNARNKSFVIFIYCDSDSHAPREVAITNFVRTPAGLFGPESWSERLASRAGESPSTGYTLHGANVDQAGWANRGIGDGDLRVNFDLICRKCRKPWTLSEGTLFKALDSFADSSVSQISLVTLAAKVYEQGKY